MKAVVIGAGLAGLAAADELQRAGAEVEVLEASGRVGGRVWSAPFGDLCTIERGAEFILPGATALVELADRFGLELAEKGVKYGDREPRGGEPVTTAELIAAVQQLREAGQPFRTAGEALAAARISSAAAAALRARLEISCTYRADDLDPSELTAATSYFGEVQTHTVVGGNMRIAEALAAALDRPVHRNAPVRRIAWTRDGVVVSTPTGELAADAAVVAVPARVMDAIVFEPRLPPAKPLRYGHAAKLFVRLREPVAPSATMSVPGRFWCYTQLSPRGERLPVLGALAGTEEALSALAVDDGPERWLDAIEELRPDLVLDRSTALLATWHDDPHIRALQVARSVAAPMNDDELARPVGPLAFAGEHTAGPEWHGTMEGAIRSGRRAANHSYHYVDTLSASR